jgi:UDP-N-acetylmuramoylalanine--D-glutamate ligase
MTAYGIRNTYCSTDGRTRPVRCAREYAMTELSEVKRVLVVGLGISGRAAASRLLRMGKEVVVNDISKGKAVEEAAAELSSEGAGIALGHHDYMLLEGVDLVVVSPGVRSRMPLLREAESRGITVWSEIELAWRFVRGPVIAVTGTNGKTTTVRMIESIFEHAGRPARAAGNIGYPLIQVVGEAGDSQPLVVEVSSFQLAYIENFRPGVAVLLNIAEDHFDWHEHMREYVEAKSRIWMNQEKGDLVVCNLDDTLCRQAARGAPSRMAYFSRRPDPEAATFLDNGVMLSRVGPGFDEHKEAVEVMRSEKLPLPGWHNLENAMAAASVGLSFGVTPETIKEALEDFRGLPHRIQFVAEVGGLRFYNDSKATNPHAAMRALSAFDDPLVLILGGRNKGLSFDELAAELEKRRSGGGIRAVYVIGEAAAEIDRAFHRVSPRMEARIRPGLEEVLGELRREAEAGDVVLFSPACASFDRYGDYKERGKHFQTLVEDYRRRMNGLEGTGGQKGQP